MNHKNKFMKKNLQLFGLLFLSASLVFTACSKDNKNGTSTLNVRLTDAPAAYSEVNVDIKEVRVKFEDDSTDNGWQTLNTKAGIYNLLAFQNGVDTLLATGAVSAKTVKQIRFVLGANNSILVDGLTFPLTVPSGAESGLKININKNLTQPFENIVIDFDALLSIKLEAGDYKLRPVLKVK